VKPAAVPRSPERLRARPMGPARRKTLKNLQVFRHGKDPGEETSTPFQKKDQSPQRLDLGIGLVRDGCRLRWRHMT